MPSGAKKGERRGGRERGQPNKPTLELLRALAEYGCSLPEQIAGLFTDPTMDAAMKLTLLEKIMPYCYPTRKPLEPDGYLTSEQAAGMLGAQAVKFRDALVSRGVDPMITAHILEDLRGHSNGQSPSTLSA